MGRGVLRIEGDGLAEAGGRTVKVVLHITQDGAQVGVSRRVLRIGCNGLVIAVHGLVEVALVRQGKAYKVVNLGVLRIDFDGLAPAGDGLIELTLALQGHAQVEVNVGIFWVDSNDPAEAGDGGVVIPLLVAKNDAQTEVGLEILRIGRDGLAVAVHGLVELAPCDASAAPMLV